MSESSIPWSPKGAMPLPAGHRLKVFLSHATSDAAVVAIVQRQIEALGIDVYLAEHDPQPGTSIAGKVETALLSADAVVVLITSTSISSAYVQQEVGLTRAHGKPIIPIVDRSVDKSRLGMLSEIEWLELDMTDPAAAIAQMTASLQPLLVRQWSSVAMAGAASPDLAAELLLLGIGLLAGLLIATYFLGGEGGSSAPPLA